MVVYLVIFYLLILLRYGLMGYPKARKGTYYLVIIGLFFFAAFRFEVGCDWWGYYNQWVRQSQGTLDTALQDREPTWWLLMFVLQAMDLPYMWLNVISSLVFFTGINVLAKRQPDPLGFLILLYPILIIGLTMSGIRQSTAVGIMAIAFTAYIDKRSFKFIALTLFASTIHNSAMIFLLLAPSLRGELTNARLVLTVLLAIPGSLALLSSTTAGVAASRYLGSDIDSTGAAFRVGVLLLTGLFFFFVLRKRWKQDFPQDYKLASFSALGMVGLTGVLPLSTVIADRLGYFMIPMQSIIFSRVPFLSSHRSQSLYAATPYIGLALLFTVWVSLSWHFQQCYVPYQTWLFGIPETATVSY